MPIDLPVDAMAGRPGERAVGGAMREVTGTLAEFPAGRADDDRIIPAATDELAAPTDELAARRRARHAG